MIFTHSTNSVTPGRDARCKGSIDELPPAAPLPGSLQTLACYLRPLAYLDWCRAALGDTFSIRPVDMPPLVFLCDPRDIRAVMGAPDTVLHPGVGGAPIEPIVGDRSFMLREEEEHARRRRAILPSFGARAMAAHEPTVIDIVEREVSTWPLDTPTALHPYLRSLTLKVILGKIFGDECVVLDALHRILLSMLSATAGPVFQEPALRQVPPWRGAWRRFLRWRAEADELFLTLIRQRRASGRRPGDTLDTLLSAADGPGVEASEREVRDNVMSMILAGHETTASELAWAFQLIAHHPRVQRRLAAEIDKGDGREYLTATVQEVLRYRPVFLFAIPRAVVAPIEIGAWTYTPPTQLLSCIYLLHHDPALYRDPGEFCPERFLGSAPQQSIWIPWGGGRKRCPGHRLATIELEAVLLAVLRTRSVLPASERIERARWRSVIVTPHAGSRVILRSRPPRAGRQAGRRVRIAT
jgi:cytochrome P450